MALAWHWLGRADYRRVLADQLAARERVWAGGEGIVYLCEHPPVITLGRSADRTNVLASSDELAAAGVTIEQIERGGDVTYHGPGQVVGYPILEIPEGRRDVHRYVRDLEEVMIRVCGDYGFVGRRISGKSGTFVGDHKIGAIGVRISAWVTSHGFAFNVNTKLTGFDVIVPCGLRDQGVTSLSKLLGTEVEMAEVEKRLAERFVEVLGYTPVASR